MTANLGLVTVNNPPASNDFIINATFNGVNGTGLIAPNGLSVTFPASNITIPNTATLSITVKNLGTAASTINSASGIIITGADGILSFSYQAPAPPATVIIAPDTAYTFNWTVTPITAGTCTPVITIQPLT